MKLTPGQVITGIFLINCGFILALHVNDFTIAPGILLAGTGFQLLLLALWRIGCRQLQKMQCRNQDLLIIGFPGEIKILRQKISSSSSRQFRVQKTMPSVYIDGLEKQLGGIDAVLLAPSISREDKAQVVAVCQQAGCRVFLIPDFYDIFLANTLLFRRDDQLMLQVDSCRLTRLQVFGKRAFDIAFSLAGLVIASPVLLVCTLVIPLISPGPIFYSQYRVGKDHKVFRLLKFRTMIKDAELDTGPVLASASDPRVTAAGKFLRAARLDELPQLFNVLKGEMSIAGPRPERPFFVEKFNRLYPEYKYRHLVKPGLTGLAQVKGKYTTSPRDKLRFDLYYMSNYSFFLDLKIILQTLPVLFNRGNSAGTAGR